MKDVLALQKMNKTKQKGKGQNPAKIKHKSGVFSIK
jgi:hypothetical protein